MPCSAAKGVFAFRSAIPASVFRRTSRSASSNGSTRSTNRMPVRASDCRSSVASSNCTRVRSRCGASRGIFRNSPSRCPTTSRPIRPGSAPGSTTCGPRSSATPRNSCPRSGRARAAISRLPRRRRSRRAGRFSWPSPTPRWHVMSPTISRPIITWRRFPTATRSSKDSKRWNPTSSSPTVCCRGSTG